MIQQNFYGFNVFNRSWAEYKVGFSNSRGNYWLGNDLLSQLTPTGRYKLRIDLQSRYTRRWHYAEYSTFIVQPESSNYRLEVSGYSGNAGDDTFRHQSGTMFSTFDRDNDELSPHNCAATYGGGFWYNNCFHCCMNCKDNYFCWNGKVLPGDIFLQSSRMWLQCK